MKRHQRVMIQKLKTQMFRAWGTWTHTFHRTYDYIFLLSPARSGSTLLTHILTSNPEILGMGESKITFADESAYRILTGKNIYFHWRNDLPRSGDERYILDKQVHNYLLEPENTDLLNKSSVRPIFLLRDPQPTLLSFMKALKVDEQSALEYYVSRMNYLEQYAQGLDPQQPSLFLTFEELTKHPQPVLGHLRRFLKLKKPLHERYQVTKTTGRFGLGDKSENIKSGRIIRPEKKRSQELAPQTQAAARKAYLRCRSILQDQCSHVVGSLLNKDAAVPPVQPIAQQTMSEEEEPHPLS